MSMTPLRACHKETEGSANIIKTRAEFLSSLSSEIILHEKLHSTSKNDYFFIHGKQHFRYTNIVRDNFSTKNVLLTL